MNLYFKNYHFYIILFILFISLSCGNEGLVPSISLEDKGEFKGFSLVPSRLEIEVGKTEKLTLIITDKDGSIISNPPLTWRSTDPKVVTVDNNGKIVGIGKGSGIIIVTGAGKEAQAFITVKESLTTTTTTTTTTSSTLSSPTPTSTESPSSSASPTSFPSNNPALENRVKTITILPPGHSIPPQGEYIMDTLGRSEQFIAIAKDADENEIKNLTFTWTSSNEKVASVDSTGLVTVKGSGKTNIMATLTNQTIGQIKSNIIEVKVNWAIVDLDISFQAKEF